MKRNGGEIRNDGGDNEICVNSERLGSEVDLVDYHLISIF